MGFGCRNVAYFVVLTLFILDIISFAASRNQNQDKIPSSQEQYANDQFFIKNHNFPSEKRSKEKRSTYTSPNFIEAELDKINIVSIDHPITIDVNNYSKKMINNYIMSGPDSIYQFRAEKENVRLRVYIEKYEIEDYKNDWLTGYNGLTEKSMNSKGKSTSDMDLKNLEDLDVLFTTRVERRLSRQVDPLEGVNSFTTDDNELTLLFRHSNEDIHESSFKLHVSTDHDTNNIAQKGGFSRPGRQLTDPFKTSLSNSGISTKGNSFSLCSDDNSYQNRIIQAIEGTISTSRKFGLKTESDTEANQNCVQNLVSKTNGNFRFEFPKEIFIGGRDSNVNGNCEDDEPYLEILDNVDGSKTRLCGRAGPETSYEFSGDLSLTYFTGSWKQEVFGFSFKYVTMCMGVVSMEVCEDKINKKKNENSKAKMEIQEENSKNLKNRDEDSLAISTQDALQMIASHLTKDDSPEIVDDYGDLIGDNENSSKTSTANRQSSSQTDSSQKTTNQNPIRGKYGQNLMHTTMAAIGILMLLILVAAGYMACQKSREQDNMIKDLTEKLTLTESSINSLMNSTIIVRKKQSSEDTGLVMDSGSSIISISNSNTEKCIINVENSDPIIIEQNHNENALMLSDLGNSNDRLEVQKFKLGSSSSSTESKL